MKIAIISGKGGSGKSSITAAFITLAPKGLVAIDCDVDASNLPILFPHTIQKEERFVSGQELLINTENCVSCGLCAKNCVYHALSMDKEGKISVNDLLCEGCSLCVELCPQKAIQLADVDRSHIYTSRMEQGVIVHGDLYPGDDNSGKMIARLRTLADEEMEKEHWDLEILDGPPGIGCPVISTITGMDKVVIVCEPTRSGIEDLKRSYRVASSFCQCICIVINKCDINRENKNSIVEFCREKELEILAELPYDKRLIEAQLNRKSIISFDPLGEISRILARAFKKLQKMDCQKSRIG